MKKFNAFTLIEMLVVLAIVGVISAIAMSSYKNYKQKSVTASLTPIFQNIKDKSLQYQATHGSFPSAVNIGLSTVTQNNVVDDSVLQSYLNTTFTNGNVSMLIHDQANVFACENPGLVESIVFRINQNSVELTNFPARLNIIYYVFNNNGAITTSCGYTYCDNIACSTGDSQGDIIQGCYNTGTIDGAAGFADAVALRIQLCGF